MMRKPLLFAGAAAFAATLAGPAWAVQATEIPAPDMLGLVALGVIGAIFLARRRR